MKIELNPWQTPNFATLKMPARERQDGFAPAPSFHLREIDAQTLSDLCDQFRAEVFAKAEKADPRRTPQHEKRIT